jgi:PAS domain S-box-containing protein
VNPAAGTATTPQLAADELATLCASLRQSEERCRHQHALLRTLIDLAPDFIFAKDPTGRFLVVNQSLARAYGRPPEAMLSHTDAELLPPDLAAHLLAEERQVLAADSVRTFEDILTFPDGLRRVMVTNLAAFRDEQGKIGGLVGISHDLTERKRAEEHIARLSRVQAILAGIDRAIVHVSDPQKLMHEICHVTVDQGGFELAWIGMAMPDGSVQPVAQAGATAYLDNIRVVVGDEPEGCGPVGTAIRENRPVVIEDIDRNELMAPWHDRAMQFGLHYVAAFPLRIAGRAAGALAVYAPRADFFDDQELDLLKQVSDDVSFALTAVSDFTARQQAEAALRRSESNLSTFFSQAPIGLVWLAASGTILRANLAQLDLLGYAADEYLGRNFNEFHSEADGGQQLLQQLAARTTVRNLRMIARCKNGAVRHLLLDANPVWTGNELLYSSVFFRDITDRVELEQEILDAREGEHRRIARDLHDGLGQLLVGAAYLTSILRQDLAAKSLPEARQSARILEAVNEAIAQTRNLARGLHPVAPEPNGLMVALKTLATRTKNLFQVRCRFICRHPVLIRDNTVATQLFWIAQEAVTNAIKHGKPRSIRLTLTDSPEAIRLAVTDDGTGIPARLRKPSGLGLRIMRYRASMINGALAVQKAAGGGTSIVCTAHPSDDAPAPPPAPSRKE